MSTVTRTAGIAGSFNYNLNQAPASAPVLTIYFDPARTIVAVTATALAATANPAVFTASYPATLAAGTYYLSFSTVFTTGQPAVIDADDTLVLVATSGSVEEPATPTVDDVARLIAWRTQGPEGPPLGTFTAATVPTAAQVAALITSVAAEVTAEVGTITDELATFARFVIALGTAAQVESSWYPDMAGANGPAESLADRYASALARLKGANGKATGTAGIPVPTFNFPTAPRTTVTEAW